MLKGVSSKAAALIETLQPYSTGEKALSPLWHLNPLSNIDKHRTLHLTGGTVQSFNFEFPPLANPTRIVNKEVRAAGAFDHNTELISGNWSVTDRRL